MRTLAARLRLGALMGQTWLAGLVKPYAADGFSFSFCFFFVDTFFCQKDFSYFGSIYSIILLLFVFLDYTLQLTHSQRTHTHPYEHTYAKPTSLSIFED
jgi:hypothetical protein